MSVHEHTGSLGAVLEAATYPGWEPTLGAYHVDPVTPFQEEDANRFWLLEGHWPRGIVPLGFSCIEDCAWGTQWAAELIPLPAGRGLSASGAFALFAPAREPVPPVFYEIGPGDVETLRGLLLGRTLSEG